MKRTNHEVHLEVSGHGFSRAESRKDRNWPSVRVFAEPKPGPKGEIQRKTVYGTASVVP